MDLVSNVSLILLHIVTRQHIILGVNFGFILFFQLMRCYTMSEGGLVYYLRLPFAWPRGFKIFTVVTSTT